MSLRPATEGRAIFLGSASDAALAVELADSELDRIFTNLINIGDAATGLVRIIAPFSPAGSVDFVPDLTIRGTDISLESSFSTLANLTLRASNDIHQLGATLITAGGVFNAFVDDVQGDSSEGGVGILRGAVTASQIRLTGNLDVDTLEGTDGDDILTGLAGADIMRGRGGADTLDGGTGIDTTTGGLGDDTHIIDTLADIVIEAVGEGTDAVQTSLTYTLGANFEKLALVGSANVNGTGNELDNILLGNSGANILDGGLGADQLKGAAGNDTYFVDNSLDEITELVGQGDDQVNSSATFALSANVEDLTLTGVGIINGTGNTGANVLIGNGSANVLTGGGGIDILTGHGGGDTLNGGTGADDMDGGLGNDTYVVDEVGDSITEAAAAGTDEVQSSISFVLAANFEELTLTGGGAINGTGNAVANVLVGNGASNILNGGVGADSMFGGAGSDTYIVDNAGDTITEAPASGTDLVQSSVTFSLSASVENLTLTGGAAINGTGNGIENVLTGNGAANTLNGGAGEDTMAGGGGNDIYVVDNAADVVSEGAAAGTDRVDSSVNFTLAVNVENLTITGAAAAAATGNNLANAITGNANLNTLNGEAGADALDGGGGDDALFGGTGNDDLTGGPGADRYRFDTALNAVTNVDDILDYSVAADTIFVDRDIFTGIAVNGVLAAAAFRAGLAAVDADDRIIHDSATGNIFYDFDGTGAAAQILFATVDPGLVLTNLDFNAYI